MTIIGPGWGGDVPSRSIPPKLVPLDVETSSAISPTPKPPIKDDGFFKSTENPTVANLSLTSQKNPKSNDVAAGAGPDNDWMSLGNVVKPDAVTSHQPIEASPEAMKPVMNELMKIAKTNGTNASIVSGIMGGLTQS
jgi:hypothetical protein